MNDDRFEVLLSADPYWAQQYEQKCQQYEEAESAVNFDYDYEVLRCTRKGIPIEDGAGSYNGRKTAFNRLFRLGHIVSVPCNGKTAYILSESGLRLYNLLAAERVKRRLLR